MKKIILFLILLVASISNAAMTYQLTGKPSADWWNGDYKSGKAKGLLAVMELQDIIEAWGFTEDVNVMTFGDTTYTMPTTDGTAGYALITDGSGTLSWGSAGSPASLDDAYNSSGAIDVDGSAVTLTVSDTDNNPALVCAQNDSTNNPTAVQITNAGTGISLDIDGTATSRDIEGTGATWYVTGAGASTFTGVATGTLTTTGTTTLGNNTSTVAVNSAAWDIGTDGAVSGITTISMSDDLTMATGKGVKSSTTTAQTVGLFAYDVDNTTYREAITLTNGNTIALALGTSYETIAVDSTTWDVSTAGVFSGVTGFTGTGTFSINDSASTNTTSIGGGTTTGTLSLGTGTGAKAINVGTGGTGAKTIAIGDGASTGSITVYSGSGDITLKSTDDIAIGSDAVAQDIAIGNETGASSLALKAGTGNITMDGVAATTITIGDSAQTGTMKFGESSATVQVDIATGTGAHTVNVANGAGAQTVVAGSTNTTSATTIQSGTGDVTITSTDDFSFTATDDIAINGGSAGSIINIGTNTHGDAINIGTDDTTADTIVIGSAKDNTKISGAVLISNLNFAADGEISDTYVITLSPAPAAYSTGMMIVFTATTANTGACTINVNGLGAKALKSLRDQDPPDNYIEAGSVVMAVYDGTNFQMIQPDCNP